MKDSPGGTHSYGDGCRNGHLPVEELADFISQMGWSDLDPSEIEEDIMNSPSIYLPEFEKMLDARTLAAS